MDDQNKMFVRIDEYKKILDTINSMKSRISDSKELLEKINNTRIEENEEINQWISKLKDIEENLIYVDENIFESGDL